MIKHFTEDITTEGGIFEEVKAAAEVNFTSSVEANRIIAEEGGDIFVEGRLNCPDITAKGVLDIMDTIESESIHIHKKGQLISGDNVVTVEIKNDGTLELGKDLKADRFDSTGNIDSKGLIESDTFNASGELRAQKIAGDTIHIKAHENSVVHTITGNNVSIKAHRENLIFKDKDQIMEIKMIDGNDVYVENVNCALLRGDKVKVGPNCKIEVIEYTEDYQFDQSSEVKELGKITRD